MNPTLEETDHFRTYGFVVFRRWFDPDPLSAELDHVLRSGLSQGLSALEKGEIRFQYVPMMTAECPVSLTLLDRCEGLAEGLLGRAVLPTRAKGCRYQGDTPWHADSTLNHCSVGFAAYLEPLGASNGALQVLPGSHHPSFSESATGMTVHEISATALSAHVLQSEPGDLIAFDERLRHASVGGSLRRQWRADYVGDPTDPAAETLVKAYFEGIFPPDWDGGYDVDRYPCYGPHWQQSPRWSAARLGALGVYELATRQEAYTRSRR